MRIFNKFVQSVKEPSNKNDIWFDGSVFRLYKQGSWTPITLTQEAMDRLIEYINGLNIYVMVDALPEQGEKGKIYILCSVVDDEYVEISEYVYDNKWKIVNNFSDIEIPLDSPFEKGSAENSAILKGGNNQVISEGSVALGKDNVVGLKGWYYKAIVFGSKTLDIYLTKNQVSLPSIRKPDIESDIECNLEVGDIISIINWKTYENKFKIIKAWHPANGFIRVAPLDENILPFTTIETVTTIDYTDYSIYCLDKYEQGYSNVGIGKSISAGLNNKSLGGTSSSFGYGNNSYGRFSFTEGIENKAGYAAHAEGRETQATGEQSHSEGKKTLAIGNHSHAQNYGTIANGLSSHSGGDNSIANGDYSISHGLRCSTNNEGEAAFGKYNNSNDDTQFSIGIGTSDTDRKNAVEVKQNGDIYITGIGGFTGANSDSSKSVQEVINELVNKLNEITTND